MDTTTVQLPTALRWTRAALLGLCAVLLVAFTVLVLYSVAMRYLMSSPPIWGEDVPKLLFVWLSFIGAGVAYFRGFNIRMTIVVEKFPPKLRRINDLALHLVVLVMLSVILWNSIPILKLASGGSMFSTGWSNAWIYSPLPIGCGLLMLNEFWRIWMLFTQSEPPPEERASVQTE